jgi:hypothetical protein
MIDRVRVRCPNCRSTVALAVLWATDDACPTCAKPLPSKRRQSAGERTVGTPGRLVNGGARSNEQRARQLTRL